MLVSVRVPKLTGWTTHYEKFHQLAQSWSVIGVAAAVRRSNGSIAEALTGVPATAASSVEAAAGRALEGASPLTDGTASAEYRTQLAPVLTRRLART